MARASLSADAARAPRGAQAPSRRIASVADALRECRLLFAFAIVFGVAVNILVLTGPLYMLQVYDRVLTSASVQTLAALTFLMVLAYFALGLVDAARALLVGKAGLRVERLLGERLVLGSWSRFSAGGVARGGELLRELDVYRTFIGGQGLIVATDLPFAPLFIAVIFLLHPWLGYFATASVLVLVAVAFLAQLSTRRRLADSYKTNAANARLVSSVAQAAETVRAMGMSAPLARRWREERDTLVTEQALASDNAARFKSATKATRFAVQSLILGLGAWLVLRQELSAGGMLAASIILGRALAPLEQALAVWGQYNAAKSARETLDAALGEFSSQRMGPALALPRVSGEVTLEKLTYAPPGATEPIVADISLTVPKGKSVGVIGPSGAGKSTLARLLVGALEPSSGAVRYDGADLRQFESNRLGQDIGYLAQDVALLPGSVKENIARFRSGNDEAVVEAARKARVHEMILRLPDGYDTPIGDGGRTLSAGQRQRIGLARALFGAPRVVVLDEPNAHLDDLGEAALADALEALSADGVTTFVVTHRMAVLDVLDALLVMSMDKKVLFGARKAVLEHLSNRNKSGQPKRIQDRSAKPAAGQTPAEKGPEDGSTP